MIPESESLRIEFKSDRQRVRDDELIEAAVCLANAEGGEIFVGVEDDGRVTGLHERHRDPQRLAAMIANRTSPPLSVRAELIHADGLPVARVEVPRSMRIVASSAGVVKRRRIGADGRPECVPFLPHEFASRASALGQLDYSTLPVQGATLDALDALERERLRRAVRRNNGDGSLLDLADAELDGALGLVTRDDESGVLRPTVLGLLLIGHEGALRRHLPTHEIAFQVMDGEKVRLNEFMHGPLLQSFERIEGLFSARNLEQELELGMFRVPVPMVHAAAFREAVANALTHRDYTRLGAVHVRWESDAVTISNPGGFVDGVSRDNLLVVEPQPRNPRLADAFKRIGLVERTGRGVDLIYRGQLRYGRPFPDYGSSTASTVVVRLSTAAADHDFLRFVIEQEKERGAAMPLNMLIALAMLWRQRRVSSAEVALSMQRDAVVARQALEDLVEAGLVEAQGRTKGRTYMLSARVYRALGMPEAYVRQAGYTVIQQEEMVLRYTREHGEIRRKDVISLCGLGEYQATRLLRRLVERGVLLRYGIGKGTYYSSAPAIE